MYDQFHAKKTLASLLPQRKLVATGTGFRVRDSNLRFGCTVGRNLFILKRIFLFSLPPLFGPATLFNFRRHVAWQLSPFRRILERIFFLSLGNQLGQSSMGAVPEENTSSSLGQQQTTSLGTNKFYCSPTWNNNSYVNLG